MDTHTWQEIINYGVPMLILGALGVAIWRITVRMMRWGFGDDSRNPPVKGVLTEKVESSTRRDETMIKFIDAMETHVLHQEELCRTHAASLGAIADSIQHDVVGAEERSRALEDLLALHTDPSMENSTASAIVDVACIRRASLRACRACHNLAADLDFPNKEKLMAECAAIEEMLRRGHDS